MWYNYKGFTRMSIKCVRYLKINQRSEKKNIADDEHLVCRGWVSLYQVWRAAGSPGGSGLRCCGQVPATFHISFFSPVSEQWCWDEFKGTIQSSEPLHTKIPLILPLLLQTGFMGKNCNIFRQTGFQKCVRVNNSSLDYDQDKKPLAVNVISEAYPMIPLSWRSNLAGR